MNTPEIVIHLSGISKEIRARQETLRTLEQQRNRIVRGAIRAGMTHAQIADATGLNRGHIGQIAQCES